MDERETTAGVAIKDGKVLVAKRAKGGPISEMWEFPGGKNRYGETIEDTLKREWLEELGVDVAVGEKLLQVDFINKDTSYHLMCHLVTPLCEDFKMLFHQDIRWVDRKELENLEFGPSDKKIRDYIISRLL
jgi:mutator protein MutT